MGGGHWVLRYCGKINFWFCGILWTSAMQFFSIVDGIKDHPPNPPPFLSFFQFPFVSETDWKWKALDLTFKNKFLIVISMLFALNVTYRAVVSTWHQVSTRYWSIMVSGEFRCNIAVCVIFFLFFAVLWCLDLLPPPPMSPSYGSHAATFFRSPDLIILHLCFFCLKWGSGNRKNIFLSCKVDVYKEIVC